MTNQKQTKNQPQEQTQTQTQETPKELEIAKRVIERVKNEADNTSWVSERLIETDNVIVRFQHLTERQSQSG